MNQERLNKMSAQVRIGGKGTARRKKKLVHRTASTDDKKLHSSLKKLNVNTIPGIEEVNMMKDDGTVLHFNNPKVQSSLTANTFAITGHAETKQITEMLPGILNQLGRESLPHLRRLAQNNIPGGGMPMGYGLGGSLTRSDGSVGLVSHEGADEDEDVPDLVENFDEASKMELKIEGMQLQDGAEEDGPKVDEGKVGENASLTGCGDAAAVLGGGEELQIIAADPSLPGAPGSVDPSLSLLGDKPGAGPHDASTLAAAEALVSLGQERKPKKDKKGKKKEKSPEAVAQAIVDEVTANLAQVTITETPDAEAPAQEASAEPETKRKGKNKNQKRQVDKESKEPSVEKEEKKPVVQDEKPAEVAEPAVEQNQGKKNKNKKKQPSGKSPEAAKEEPSLETNEPVAKQVDDAPAVVDKLEVAETNEPTNEQKSKKNKKGKKPQQEAPEPKKSVEVEAEANKPEESPVEDKKPEEVPVKGSQPNEAPVEEKKPKESAVEEKSPKEAPVEEQKPKEAPAEESNPKEAPTEETKPKEAPVDEKKPVDTVDTSEKKSEEPVAEAPKKEAAADKPAQGDKKKKNKKKKA